MASIHLKKLIALLLTAMLNTALPAAGNALLTAEQRHIALSVQTMSYQYLNHGNPPWSQCHQNYVTTVADLSFSSHTTMT